MDFFNSFKRYCVGSGVLAGLILTNVIVFVAVWIVMLAGRQMGISGNFTMPWLCVSSIPEVALTRPWTLITYMVTQYDFIHLLFNVLWLYWFGVFIPFSVTERKKLWLYAGGGILGAILYIAVSLIAPSTVSPGGYLCGASASVLAIMTAVALWSPRREIRLLLIGPVQLRWVAIVCLALTFLGLNGGSGAAQSAHVGGVIFGALFAGADILRSRRRPAEPKRRKVRINVRRDGRAVADAASRLSDTDRLDQLLEKIRVSGYSSLTAGERNELNLISQRLDKNQRK